MRLAPLLVALLVLPTGCGGPGADGDDPLARPERTPDPGRGTARRLNRDEYNNTVRDLLLTDLRPADGFPDDDTAHGWDNMADALSLSPLHVEMYEQAADRLIETELPSPVAEPVEHFFEGESGALDATTGAPTGDHYNLWSNGSLTATVRIEHDGEYLIEARLGATQAGGEVARAALLVDGRTVATVDVTGQRAFAAYPARVELTAGAHQVGVAFLNDFYDPDAGQDRNLLVDWFRLEGPLGATGEPTAARARYYTCTPTGQDRSCAEEVLVGFATRAWRRPPDADGQRLLLTVFDAAVDAGADWEEAVHAGIKAALLSPRFLFRLEVDPAPGDPVPRPLDGYELASRLSYFLWRSMPDDRLLALAADDELQDPEVLRAEVRRMLQDPRADTLVTDYAGQWLHIRAVGEVEPDYATFPGFDDALRQAMQTELELFAADIILGDRPMHELLTADETWVNPRLAAHYGVRAPDPSGWAPTTITDHPRTGLLGKAGLLTALSFPLRTSPVKRGAWVMEALLCEAPPPAPAAVEGLPADVEGLPLREQMERHREDPACATCHRVMDPIGFSMENYDAVGAWRTEDDLGHAIDASGTWPGGPVFDDVSDLSQALATDDRIPGCITEKTFAYALGRPAGIEDIPYLDGIEADFVAGEQRFSVLAEAIVLSEPFRLRRGEP